MKEIDQEVLKKIMQIKFEFGFQAGRWEQNEYLQDDVAREEFAFITDECDKEEFEWKLDWDLLKMWANDYDEKLINLDDVIAGYVDENNYFQFDALACDIEDQLINHLAKQL